MGAQKNWAAVWTRQSAAKVAAEYAWSAAAEQDGALFVSSVLPWRGAGKHWKGPQKTTADRTAAALDQIKPLLHDWNGAVVFGGDFNHALEGREYAGSLEGRVAIIELLGSLELKAPTAGLSHRVVGASSIDHITIPVGWSMSLTERVLAADGRGRLSDHDAYVVETTQTSV
jgi:hypothetical protein